ncbi:MAG: hypothetical protein IPJ69_05915 [Deltaproteobacteria bacterium]|nr:MAG: hypothetical protein IPJ69_05915 [Deltaproteobacteria bacterium]
MKLALKIFFITVTLLVSFQAQVVAAPCSSSEIIISRTADDNNPGSLRYAINQALASSTPLSLCSNNTLTLLLATPLPTITRSLTLRASDQHTLTITRQSGNSAPFFSLFRLDSPSNNIIVNLENISFNNGVAFVGGVSINDIRLTGGAIYVGPGDSLNVTNAEFNLNTADYNGGALYNDGGSVVINKSIFHNNDAPSGSGGALYNTSTGTMTLNRSQCYSNSASYMGGCIANFGNLNINNSTFVENQITRGFGGGIYNLGSLSLRNVSIVNNFADSGGGFENSSDSARGIIGRVNMANTVMAYNRTTVTPRHDCRNFGGIVTSRGNNLIQNSGYCTITNNPSDFGSADLIGVNPGYDNISNTTYSGGNIPAPLLTSPLIDRGKQNECLSAYNTDSDILGEVRLGPCDIGAVESKLNISLPSVSISIPESSTTVSLTINQSFTTVPNTIQYTTQDETATSGRDYVAASGPITFSAYSTSNTLTLNLAPDDTVHDGDKTFLVILSSSTPGVNISYSRLIARITIVDNDPLPISTGGSGGTSGMSGSGGVSGTSGFSGSGGLSSSGGTSGGGSGGSSGSGGMAPTAETGGSSELGISGSGGLDGSGGSLESSTGGTSGDVGSDALDAGTGGGSSDTLQSLTPNSQSGGCSLLQGLLP